MTQIDLNKMEHDALNEMGNIGTGNAATALSQLLSKNVDMNIPVTKFIPLYEFANELGGPEKIVSSIYLKIWGDLDGEVLFIFPVEGAYEMVDLLLNQEIGTTKAMNTMNESAFKELSNILAGSFLNALAAMLDVKLLPSIPYTATDMAQAICDIILIKTGAYADEMLCVTTKINVQNHHIDGTFLVLFDDPSLKRMLQILDERYGHLDSP